LTMWVGAVVVVDPAGGAELDPQAASERAADATAVPTTRSLVSLRFPSMIVPDLLVATARFLRRSGGRGWAIAARRGPGQVTVSHL